MTTLLITVHLASCIMLILVVLLQAGRGADMGAAFGGASSPMFGSGSASNPLTRMTTITAVMFLTTALFLAVASARRASVFDSAVEPLAAPPRAESSAPVGIPAGEAAPAAPIAEAQPMTIPAVPAPGDAAPNADAPAAAPADAVPADAPKAAVPADAPNAAAPGAPAAAPEAVPAPDAPARESAPAASPQD